MAIPDFIVELRDKVGTSPLWLSAVIAAVVRDDEVLMVRRADDGRWEPVAGIIEPGEHPADTAEREILEEAGVVAEVERIVGVDVSDSSAYPNGDQVQFLEIVLRCKWISGEPYPADGEAAETRWVHRNDLGSLSPAVIPRTVRHLEWVFSEGDSAAFRRA